MRILVVGAGAVGGYFGGRLLEAGRDVTFLVRHRRAAELEAGGLRIRSGSGDIHIPLPPTVQADDLNESFDLVLLSCKAFDLSSAVASFAPAVGAGTVILPLLNGMRHIDILVERFGSAVLGGRCLISSTLNQQREIVHFGDIHAISFGELDGALSGRIANIEKLFTGPRFEARGSGQVVLEMWEKWIFIAALAGSTCLMRATVGDICAAPGGKDFMLHLIEEARAIAASNCYPPRQAFLDRATGLVTTAGSPLTASMLRDMEAGGQTEADHIIGDLIARAGGTPLKILPVVYTALKAYESKRHRMASETTSQG